MVEQGAIVELELGYRIAVAVVAVAVAEQRQQWVERALV